MLTEKLTFSVSYRYTDCKLFEKSQMLNGL